MPNLPILTVILLGLLTVGRAIFLLIHYRQDPFICSVNTFPFEWKLITMADWLYRKDGGFWLKTSGRLLVARKSEHPVAFTLSADKALSVTSDGQTCISKEHTYEEMVSQLPEVWIIDYTSDPNIRLLLPSATCTLTLSIKATTQWILEAYQVGTPFLLKADTCCPTSKGRLRWASLIMLLYKAENTGSSINLVSSSKLYGASELKMKRLHYAIVQIMFQLPSDLISSLSCPFCNEQFPANQLQAKYFKIYNHNENGDIWGVEWVRRFFCPRHHVLAGVSSFCFVH